MGGFIFFLRVGVHYFGTIQNVQNQSSRSRVYGPIYYLEQDFSLSEKCIFELWPFFSRKLQIKN